MSGNFRESWSYPHGDPSILLFDRAVKAGWMDLPRGARVLELGCAETDFHAWLMKADPTIQLTGVDVNDCPGYSGTFIRGAAEDYLAVPSSRGGFEAVICLGSLEHFGLGFYGDPKNVYADTTTAHRAFDWLAPGGWWYYDVPWTPDYGGAYITDNRHFRVYDDDSVASLDRPGFLPKRRAYAHGNTNTEQPTRPVSAIVPFWYLQRLVEKPA